MLDRAQVEKAAKALLKHEKLSKKKLKKAQLFDEDAFVLLVVTLSRIPPESKAKPIRIPIPHSIYEEAEVCVFTKDPQKEYKEKFAECGAPVVKTIGLTKLRQKYKSFEAKRQLAQSYDLFMVDDRISSMMAPLVGKAFFKRKKQPIQVNLKKQDLKKVIERARDSTYMYRSSGPTCTIRVARTSFSEEQVVENILQVVGEVVEKTPRKWRSIQNIAIRTLSSISLPVYQSLPELTPQATEGGVLQKRKRMGEAEEAATEAEEAAAVSSTATAATTSASAKTPKKKRRKVA